MYFSNKRQRFLINQGYSYKVKNLFRVVMIVIFAGVVVDVVVAVVLLLLFFKF